MNSWLRAAAFPMFFGILFAATALAAQQNSPEPPRAASKDTAKSDTVFKTRINPKDGAVMIFIPAGPFLMGDEDQKGNPRHTVTLSGYWIYKDLVTVGMYKRFRDETGKGSPPVPRVYPKGEEEDHPIVDLSWYGAVEYCKWAGVTLPTEAQWEKAARGTDGRKYPWGDTFDRSKVWASKSLGDAGDTHPVGELGVSPYGCTDMAGNAWQWCADLYNTDFWRGRKAHRIDPVNKRVGDPDYRIMRGGSWMVSDMDDFRASFRGRGNARYPGYDVGFRCAAAL